MPFDFTKYDAKCATMDQDALQREWEHYTRLISGAATSTAVSGAAVPFTLGVSAIGVGFSAPAIHNARKKREIIDKHLQKLGATHNTRKRDVLTPVAVSGTVGLLTLGCCHAGTDAIVNKAAEHSIASIAENEIAVKVGTHLALETAAVSAEEAHASHKKEKESLKAYMKLAKAGRVPPPSPGPSYTSLSPSPSQYNTDIKVDSKDVSYPLTPSISLSPPPQHPGLPISANDSYFPPPPGPSQATQSNFAYPPSPVYTPDGKFPAISVEATHGNKGPMYPSPPTPFTPLSPTELAHDQFVAAEHKVLDSCVPSVPVSSSWHGTKPCEVENVVAALSTLHVSNGNIPTQGNPISVGTSFQSHFHKMDPVAQTSMPQIALNVGTPYQDSTSMYFPPAPSPNPSQRRNSAVFSSFVSQQAQATYEPQPPQSMNYGSVPAQSPQQFLPIRPQGHWYQPPVPIDQPAQTNNMTQYHQYNDPISHSYSSTPHVYSQPPLQQSNQQNYPYQHHNDLSYSHQYHTFPPASPPSAGYNSTTYDPTSYNPATYNPANYDPSAYSVPAYDPSTYARRPSQG